MLEQFERDKIARAGAESVRRRELVARATAMTPVRWDYEPRFDATTHVR